MTEDSSLTSVLISNRHKDFLKSNNITIRDAIYESIESYYFGGINLKKDRLKKLELECNKIKEEITAEENRPMTKEEGKYIEESIGSLKYGGDTLNYRYNIYQKKFGRYACTLEMFKKRIKAIKK